MELHEPLVTWNLYITPIAISISTGVIMLFVTRMFNMRDRKDEEIAKLIVKANEERETRIKESERWREENSKQWRENVTTVQCKIKETLQRIENKLEHKVEKEDCIRESENKWDAIDKIRNAIGKNGKMSGGI
jgi:hypothetical protein